MEDELKETQFKQRNTNLIATISLLLSMVIMGLWGFTPLKKIIPALLVLNLFIIFCLIAVAFTILGIYRGMQVKALKARIEDQ
jgi:uncharacterized membrane protein